MGHGEGALKPKKTKHKNNNSDAVQQRPNSQSSVGNGTLVRQISQQRVRVRALYDYVKMNHDDLEFTKGDILFVTSDMSVNWWLAEHSITKRRGYVPCNHLIKDDGSPESLDAWHPITFKEAVRKLMLMGISSGTYILRYSADPQVYALSVRIQEDHNTWIVRHYKIRPVPGNHVYVYPDKTFSTIQDLIFYYSSNDGLCCRLTTAFPRQYKPPVQFRQLEVNRDNIKLTRTIGKGNFGEVWLAKWNNCHDVAVKVLHSEVSLDSLEQAAALKEAKVMHSLHHPHIVQILGVSTEPTSEPIFIITDYMAKGSLKYFLQSNYGQCLKIVQLTDMMAQIAEGMAYLEAKSFVHRDLRAANILVDADNTMKVSDFGLARILDSQAEYKGSETSQFPIKWTAPESIISRVFNIKSDVWSFGVLMYEMVTLGGDPYPGLSKDEVLNRVPCGYRMLKPIGHGINCPDGLYGLMWDCWQRKPENRPTFKRMFDFLDTFDGYRGASGSGTL